jgi:uncharacterized membrane protein
VLALAWLLAWKYPSLLLPHLCLIVSILLGVTGILSGVPSWLMICGAAAALAAWDLLLLISALKNVSATGKNRLYEVWHFQSLALAVGGGLLVAFLGQMLSFQIPFPILLILTAGVVFLLERVSRIIKKRSPEA